MHLKGQDTQKKQLHSGVIYSPSDKRNAQRIETYIKINKTYIGIFKIKTKHTITTKTLNKIKSIYKI